MKLDYILNKFKHILYIYVNKLGGTSLRDKPIEPIMPMYTHLLFTQYGNTFIHNIIKEKSIFKKFV